jgi:hypothetical protein
MPRRPARPGRVKAAFCASLPQRRWCHDDGRCPALERGAALFDRWAEASIISRPAAPKRPFASEHRCRSIHTTATPCSYRG